MFATVRNRRGIVSAVDPFDGQEGRLHLVHLDYKDDQLPTEERLLWELEPRKTLLEPTALPDILVTDPMPAEDFDALLRAARWTAATPFLDPDGGGPLDRLPISSPFHGAVQVEDFQLVPLLKALQMPRVNLLIADDVGLGKTVEAGLILSELLLRRRIQRVLILTPASLRLQWRDEMWDKFSLPFDLVDRAETHALHRRLGMDANPWRSFSRIIASYHYLRQEDVLTQFLAACRTPEGSPHLPWDLLIVDECHNLMPSPFGDDSDLCRMLRLLAPQFEHRLFLSATPHNGHTRSFTGLLEILDPVRFSQTDALRPAERERVQQVVLRRLKREINARTNPPRFCRRNPPQALLLSLSPEEIALSAAFDGFRTAIRRLAAESETRRRRAGSFAVEILGKRLLSCPTAFAESWRRCREGLTEGAAANEADVMTAKRNVERETGDDRETQSREATAAGVVGAWLKAVAADLQEEIAAIDAAVCGMGFALSQNNLEMQNPSADARFAALTDLIEKLLRPEKTWRNDERLVVFTEYKTTLDYLTRRLRERYEPDRILTLFGGMDEQERDLVKNAFNDPNHKVRILLATDAAAEGLNLQRTARYLLHFDCPWNPSRLEQRNGRVDRHGQARDVTIHHFATDQDQDLRFLTHVIRKADEIREDLGSANELFDEAAHRRLVQGEGVATVQADLDQRIAAARGRASVDADASAETGADGRAADDRLRDLAAEIDHDPDALRDTLEGAMAIRGGRPQFQSGPEGGTYRLLNPGLSGWSEIIDETLRRNAGRGSRGAVSRLAFSPDPFMEQVGERQIFCPRPDVSFLHLSHPLMQRSLAALTRRRFPGGGEEVSRWTVRQGEVPPGVEAIVLVGLEELAVNDLRETFHHWVRTILFPIRKGVLGEPLAHRPARELRRATAVSDEKIRNNARDLLDEVVPDLKRFLTDYAAKLTSSLKGQLASAGVQARRREEERYRSRQGEVSSLIAENTLGKLEREIEKLQTERRQGLLFDEEAQIDAIDRSIEEKKEEIARRTRHYEEVRIQLERERERIVRVLLPRRHAMPAAAQVFPVAIEVRLPGGGAS
ncbi:MAG TPA: DISARM system SNF2-like helicase DrmD [Smithellaceae bacterium]|nr:DISARM system SNF2-like helicase DrmD [Syntrophales bacterium]HPL67404.1 DISARM system SNF2-like helicase DrmD [Smithellaceae bacterium]